jgi:hypothetical protein
VLQLATTENVSESNRLWQKVKENMLRLVRLNYYRAIDLLSMKNLVNCWKLSFHRETISSEASTTSILINNIKKNTNNRKRRGSSSPLFFHI